MAYASMVKFEDPVIVAQDYMMVAKLWSAVDGLYIWEFITTLHYEWSIIRGRRSHNWTIWIYATTRLSALVTVILNIQSIGMSARYNCDVRRLPPLPHFIGYIAVASASLLIVLRILAIWNKKRAVVVMAFCVWGINVVFTIQSIIHSAWVPSGSACAIDNMDVLKINVLTFGLGRLLWKQGLIWFSIATLAEALPAVKPLDSMFLDPSVVAISIAATRIHRSLTDFAATACHNLPHILDSVRNTSGADGAHASPIPLNHIEVAVHKTYEIAQRSHHVSFVAAEGLRRDKSAKAAEPGPGDPEVDITLDITSAESRTCHSHDSVAPNRDVGDV
ncbi:hypothetical protein BJV77DRAFT_971496 [Russula vinacea]|nr:hypothetical protein BJV77DRAFT_971496 [Russula vinacea]